MLHERVDDLIANRIPLNSFDGILKACVEDHSLEAMLCVRRLFEFGQNDLMIVAPSAWALACWGDDGIDQLVEVTLHCPTPKNCRFAVVILCSLATGFDENIQAFFCPDSLRPKIKSTCLMNPSLSLKAQNKLMELFLSFNDDEVLDIISTVSIQLSMEGLEVTKELLAALSSRWLSISKPLLAEFEQLIINHSDKESIFQDFLSTHPQLLDPLAAEVWPQPDLHGAKKPDFVVRRFDNTYLVVEIETPAKLLVTKANQISAYATQAVSQATDYRTFIRKLPNVEVHFPGLDDLHCLVVVGLERDLNDVQMQALRNDNMRSDSLRIVGFDWLADRARTVQMNLVRNAIQVYKKRVI